MKQKRGAFEMSITTVVILVIAMAMLILGLVLVRNVFKGATTSVDTINEKVRNQIINLFNEEDANVVVKLGGDKVAKIPIGTDSFGIGIGARTLDGSSTTRERLQYKLSLQSNDDCIKKLGAATVKSLFLTPVEKWNNFDEYTADSSFARIVIKVPQGTVTCTQKVYIDVKDTKAPKANANIGGTFFQIDIVKKGIF